MVIQSSATSIGAKVEVNVSNARRNVRITQVGQKIGAAGTLWGEVWIVWEVKNEQRHADGTLHGSVFVSRSLNESYNTQRSQLLLSWSFQKYWVSILRQQHSVKVVSLQPGLTNNSDGRGR